MDDVRVREAINLAINREGSAKWWEKGAATDCEFCGKTYEKQYDWSVFCRRRPPFEENVKKARELLSQAGYPDGKGFPILTYKYPSLELDADTAQVVQEQLKQNLNIEIHLEAPGVTNQLCNKKSGKIGSSAG